MSTKSPFMIYSDAVSPMQCENIVDSVEFIALDIDKFSKPIETTKMSDLGTAIIHQAIRDREQDIVKCFGSGIAEMDDTRIIWADSTVVPRPQCDNSVRVKDKWLRVHNRDLTAVVFMSDFNDRPPFDDDFEVYGGKLEFPSHGFGFNSVRGTMIIMPSDPHFTHVFSPVLEGDLFISKTFITLKTPFLYTPKLFPGTWKEWLNENF